jgi:hypothetical protein
MLAGIVIAQTILKPSRLRAGIIAGVVFLSVVSALAKPPKLVVRPRGINVLELAASSLRNQISYEILARTNSPTGQWRGLTWILGGSNSTVTTYYNLSEASHGLTGLTLRTLPNWSFAIGSGEDSDGNGLPDVYEDLVTRSDPYSGADPYGDPDGDGWTTLQEMQNGTDPLRYDTDPPPPSGVSVRYFTNNTVKVTWSQWGGSPDYFVIEKAQRTLRPGTNVGPFILQPPSRLNKTNLNEYLATQREIQRRFGRPFSQRQDAISVTGEFHFLAQVPARPGQHDYSYTETNAAVTPFSDPSYRIRAHFTPPLHAFLDHLDIPGIRQTMLPVTARQTTNGYDLTVVRPIPYACYLLLVRDRNNPQWRASGYFTSGTNRNPVHLHVDPKGMMHEGQGPLAMPEVHLLPDVVVPEFTAGWGEDSDGDGLPDIYEVLVTGTDPLKTDTGNTGVVDAYKEPANDGWSNLEKFRRRADPLKAAFPPAPMILRQPTLMEAMQATIVSKTDLRFEPQIEIRIAGTPKFQTIQQSLLAFYQMANPRNLRSARPNFDLRVSWRVPQPHPREQGYHGP